jgi:uncharacterized protein YjbI with pentapeptide repeats
MSILVLLVVTMILVCPQPALAQDCEKRHPESGEKIVEMLSSQQRVLKDCVQVKGDIDLRSLGTTTVTVPFILTNSTVEGALIAPSTVFKGTVDFTNTTFSGETKQSSIINLRGSIFEGDVIWSRAKFRTTSEKPLSVNFSGVRFRGITDLRGAEFKVPAQFRNVIFEGSTSFQQTRFYGTADFIHAAFYDKVSFIHASFRQRASFEGANAAQGADFTGARLLAEAVFRRMSVQGRLSMPNAYFGRKVFLDGVFVGALELGNNDFLKGVQLSMANIMADSLEMDLEDVDRIDHDDEKRAVLEVLERTARNKRSTSAANDALFRLRVLENNERGQPLQILNRIFNEGVAGYGVRPLHPLIGVLVVALIGGAVRLVCESRPSIDPLRRHYLSRSWWAGRTTKPRNTGILGRLHRRETTPQFNEKNNKMTLRLLDERLAVILGALGASLHAALSPKLNISIKREERVNLRAYVVVIAQWVEWVSQKVLIGLFLLPSPTRYQQLRKLLPL